ncbi:hypothetical protein BC830DRAFT_1230716 [Chytriomyces sp. MP71]|nr:hypothetical protein BC830DRAFT_1230716 [Chytriomyces sp. MP71]
MSTLLHLLAAAALGSPPPSTDFPVKAEPTVTGAVLPISSNLASSDETGRRRAVRSGRGHGNPAPRGIDKPRSTAEPSTPTPSESVASVASSLENTPNLAHFEATSETGFPVLATSPSLTASPAPQPAASSPFSALPPLNAPKRYECKDCGKIFHRKHHLVSHLVSHSDGKPFACQIPGCDSMFRRMQDMRRHMRKVRHEFLVPHNAAGAANPSGTDIPTAADVSMSLLAPPADNNQSSHVEISSDLRVAQAAVDNHAFSHIE